MKVIQKLLTTTAFFILLLNSLSAFAAAAPAGNWFTIDDKSHQTRSIVQIWNSNNGLYGKVLKIFPQAGDKGICRKCPGRFKDKPIKGLTVMWGLKPAGNNVWKGGQILDPKNGRVYRCKITLSPDGKKLMVRGYVGITLLGRTQTWVRAHG